MTRDEIAGMDVNADGTLCERTTIEDAYRALEVHLRCAGDRLAISEAFANEDNPNPARDMTFRELADFVGETMQSLQDRFENDGTLL